MQLTLLNFIHFPEENLTGGSFKAKVKYSFFPSVSKTIDLCDLAKLGGLSCPISQNTTQVVLEQQLPSFPGVSHAFLPFTVPYSNCFFSRATTLVR